MANEQKSFLEQCLDRNTSKERLGQICDRLEAQGLHKKAEQLMKFVYRIEALRAGQNS